MVKMDNSYRSILNSKKDIPVPPPLSGRLTASYRSKKKIMGCSSGNNFVCTTMPNMWDHLFDEGYRADILINTDSGHIIYAHTSILGMASPILREMLKQSKGGGQKRTILRKGRGQHKSISIHGAAHKAVKVCFSLFVFVLTCVFVAKEFLEIIERNVLPQRPSWRVNDAKANTQCESALLLSDLSVFPHSALKDEFCISVEIKPKCGFLPTSRYIADENYVKRCITRFKMHQALKLHQGKISKISEYDPLDLFSGSLERVNKAMKDLIFTPQNNLRVFLNGSLIFGGSGGVADSTSCLNEELLEDALKCVVLTEDGKRTTNFLHLVAEAVSRPGLLDRLLEVQKLDKLDIEGAIHAYYNVISQPCPVCRVFKEDKKKLSERYTSLHSYPLSKSLKIVKDYLIAATAKDLSIMISFRPTEKRVTGSSNDIVSLKSNSQCFEYKASFIDLDMKPLKKMAYYFELDQKIVRHYSQMVKSNIYSERVASIKDTLHHEQTSAVEDVSHTRDSSVIGA